ncbi:MAG TPA: class I SAM-dependent methyltransferase [Polyangiaceae bacterium]|nr:class I SAM-dependent methyltransferase [Polyangiaceae bacterium]
MTARARLIEDLVEDRAQQGATQYVLLGAGLDAFAQRKRTPGQKARASRLPCRAVEQSWSALTSSAPCSLVLPPPFR